MLVYAERNTYTQIMYDVLCMLCWKFQLEITFFFSFHSPPPTPIPLSFVAHSTLESDFDKKRMKWKERRAFRSTESLFFKIEKSVIPAKMKSSMEQ